MIRRMSRDRTPLIDRNARRAVRAGWLARALVVALAALGAGCAGIAPMSARPGPADALDGLWLGDATYGSDRVVVGFAFDRDAAGALVAKLTQPIVNVYASQMPGTLAIVDGHLVHAELGLDLTRHGDALDGTWGRSGVRLALRRATALPVESPLPDVPRGPGPRWQAKLGAPIYAMAAARDGVAYVGTTGGVFHAVRVRDGSIAWTFAAGRPIHGEALVTDAHVYFACDDGHLYKLDRATGREVWRSDLGDAQVPRVLPHSAVYDYDYQAPRPLLHEGVVYVGSGDGHLYAIDDAGGRLRWRLATDAKVRTAAIVVGERIVFGSLDGKVRAVDRRTGVVDWTTDLRGAVTTTPALIGGRIVTGGRGAVLVALDPGSGAVTWRSLFWGSWVESEPVAYDDRLYIGSSDLRRVSALDPRDGRVAWRTDVAGSAWGRPAVTSRTVYAGVVGTDPYPVRHVGGVVAIDRASGALAWRWPAPAAPGALQTGFVAGAIVTGDTLVVGGLDGALYGFPAS
jgi:outer membrane protein assembly factor BamB